MKGFLSTTLIAWYKSFISHLAVLVFDEYLQVRIRKTRKEGGKVKNERMNVSWLLSMSQSHNKYAKHGSLSQTKHCLGLICHTSNPLIDYHTMNQKH